MVFKMKKVLIGIGILILVIAIGVGIFFGVYIYPFMKAMKKTETIPYDDKLTLIIGGGGNSGILVSDSLVLVVDTKMDDAAKELYEKVKTVAGDKPILVVNTHIHSDHTKGNVLYKGQQILVGGNYTKETWTDENGVEAVPTQWLKDTLTISLGDEKVTIFNLGINAHTQSDVFVYLNNRKVLFGGDVILNKQAPALFGKYNADPAGYLKAFDLVTKRFEIKTIVPGHGNVGGSEVIEEFRTYFNDIQSASTDPSKEDEIVKKYESWRQIPFAMSPKASIGYVKGLNK